ncbi:hypothetical protein B0T25DRAFT_575175 [Lasiosphaeria hispida]|uniref:Uncharacterized protein n=1 Tax=Lasiosphaeria hispida TaxID=260671 RepID=A0AAJ0MJ93_9PEZI|nr:hypothetical protein B0T25DRAFT_575175 [Lasiosphaeria hispida]
MKSCSWTKLLLDKSAETAKFDDPSLHDAVGSAFFRLPPGKDAQMVCEDFLTEVYRFVIKNLKMGMTPEIFDVTPMECYLTVPAIWTDKARAATRDAAVAAGFGSRIFDSIQMTAEPEAAAFAALKKDLRPGSVNAVKLGDNVLILDCGGGTMDITMYSIRKTFPNLEFDEICVGIGGKCGSTYIDRNFLMLMARRFGQAFEDVPMKRKGPGSEFMKCFEKDYDEDEASVMLSKRDLECLFEPVVDDILRLLSQQVRSALRGNAKRINEIYILGLVVLVGGFGSSDYLKGAIDAWCAKNGGIKCIRSEFW